MCPQMKRTNRGRPKKANALNSNLSLRILPSDRVKIEQVASMMGMSLNKFTIDAAVAVVDMINLESDKPPPLVVAARYLKKEGIKLE